MATATLKGALLCFVIDYAKAIPYLYRKVMSPLNEVSNLVVFRIRRRDTGLVGN